MEFQFDQPRLGLWDLSWDLKKTVSWEMGLGPPPPPPFTTLFVLVLKRIWLLITLEINWWHSFNLTNPERKRIRNRRFLSVICKNPGYSCKISVAKIQSIVRSKKYVVLIRTLAIQIKKRFRSKGSNKIMGRMKRILRNTIKLSEGVQKRN